MATDMPCHWTKDSNGDPVMIPECYGCANHPGDCTCEVRGSQLDQIGDALQEAEARIEQQTDTIHQLNKRLEVERRANSALRARIRELEQKVLEKTSV